MGAFPHRSISPRALGRSRSMMRTMLKFFTEDNIKGAIDTSAFTVTSAKAEMPWELVATATTIVCSTDAGKGYAANPTGGSFTVTLDSAVTCGDGKTIAIKHTGTANQVTIATVSSQTIQHHDGGSSRTTWPLTEQDQTVWLASDGANWHVISQVDDMRQHLFLVVDDDLFRPARITDRRRLVYLGRVPFRRLVKLFPIRPGASDRCRWLGQGHAG